MERRAFLAKSAVGVAGVTALAGCGGDTEPEPDPTTPATPTESEPTVTEEPVEEPSVPDGYDRVVDVVDRGADPSGEESLVPVLNDIDADGTLVYLPPGRYRMDDSWRVVTFDRLGLVGKNATIVPDPGLTSFMISLDGRGHASDLRVEGVTFDYTHPDASGRMLHLKTPDGLLVRDVRATGTVGSGPDLVRVDVTDPDGNGLVEHLSLPDGASGESGITGCYVGNNSVGDITFRDCRIEGFPDNGLYAEPPAGSITVEGGYFANCGIACVRVRADSVVRNVYVRCDEAPDGFLNMRGIRLTDYEPQNTSAPGVVENCRVDMEDATYSDGAITLSSKLARAVVRDTVIRTDADDVPAFRAKSPDAILQEFDLEPSVRLENVTVEGAAAGGQAIRIEDRHSCVLEGLEVQQSGQDRNGILFNRSTGRIRDSSISVTKRAIVVQESDIERSNVDIGETGVGAGSR